MQITRPNQITQVKNILWRIYEHFAGTPVYPTPLGNRLTIIIIDVIRRMMIIRIHITLIVRTWKDSSPEAPRTTSAEKSPTASVLHVCIVYIHIYIYIHADV